MTGGERETVVELLELAHGYSILGSLVPFMEACVELGVPRGSKPALLASFAIKKCQLVMVGGDRKPTSAELQGVILAALDYVTAGTEPIPPRAPDVTPGD